MATISFILELIKQKLQKQHHPNNKTTYTKISQNRQLSLTSNHITTKSPSLHLQTQLYITSTTTFDKSQIQHEINCFKRPYLLLYRICICATRHDVPDSSPAYGTVCNPVFS